MMNVYILNCLQVTLSLVELLVDHLAIAGILSLKKECYTDNEFYDYSYFARKRGISHLEIHDYSLNDKNDQEMIKQKNIDLLIVCGWQRLIPSWLIHHCKVGAIGCHGSSEGITKGRGRSPQNWALIAGQSEFEVSVFWIDEGIDSGAIIDSRRFALNESDDIVISYEKVCISVAEMVITNLNNNRLQSRFGIRQKDTPAYLPKRVKEDGKIDWKRKGREIYNFVRALTLPYPCAFTTLKGTEVDIIECKYIDIRSSLFDHYECGRVVLIQQNSYPWVKCMDGIIEIRKYRSKDTIVIEKDMLFESAIFSEQIEGIIERHNRKTGRPVSSMIRDMYRSGSDIRDEV